MRYRCAAHWFRCFKWPIFMFPWWAASCRQVTQDSSTVEVIQSLLKRFKTSSGWSLVDVLDGVLSPHPQSLSYYLSISCLSRRSFGSGVTHEMNPFVSHRHTNCVFIEFWSQPPISQENAHKKEISWMTVRHCCSVSELSLFFCI